MTEPAFSAAADRNKQPILDVLQRVLGERGVALEIASGTGQHLAWFADAMRQWTWQPTDVDAGMLPAIETRLAETGLSNLRAPLLLDVMTPPWPSQGAPFTEGFDAIYCANMLHIAPAAACAGLMQGAARHLLPGGLLVTYGPYFEDGMATAGNLAFDESLQARNASWGIRRLKDVEAQAVEAGLVLRERYDMPANNLLLIFESSKRPANPPA